MVTDQSLGERWYTSYIEYCVILVRISRSGAASLSVVWSWSGD
jgi:hypothetical protein